MTIEQTVEIPANHRLVIDVPREIPEATPFSGGKFPPNGLSPSVAEMFEDFDRGFLYSAIL